MCYREESLESPRRDTRELLLPSTPASRTILVRAAQAGRLDEPTNWLRRVAELPGSPYPGGNLQFIEVFSAANLLAGQVISGQRHQSASILLAILARWSWGDRVPAHAVRPASESPGRGGELVAVAAQRAGQLQPLFRRQRRRRSDDAADPGPPGSRQPGDRRDRAGAGRELETTPGRRDQTLKLRKGVTFSDGMPFTSADVLFSFAVAYDAAGSRLGDGVTVAGQPLEVAAPDPATVVADVSHRRSLPACASSTICRSCPKHKLDAALRSGHDPEGLDAGDAAHRDRRPRPVRPGRARRGTAARVQRAIRTTGAATSSRRRCRIWTS